MAQPKKQDADAPEPENRTPEQAGSDMIVAMMAVGEFIRGLRGGISATHYPRADAAIEACARLGNYVSLAEAAADAADAKGGDA